MKSQSVPCRRLLRGSQSVALLMAIVATFDHSALAQDLSAGGSIGFENPKASRVSLAIYNEDDQMVRTLLTGKPMEAGNHLAHWDGLDRYGNQVPAGEYRWKLVATQGLRAEFIMQVGQNVDPIWERATGNHEPPIGAAIDATGLYRVGATNEGGHYAVKTDLSGKHVWAVDRYAADPWAQGTVAVTLGGDRLFELMPNGDLYGYDAKTGKVFTGGNFDPKPWNLCWEGYLPPDGTSDEEKRKLRAKQCPADLAADSSGNLLLASYPQHQAISWFSTVDRRLIATVKNIPELGGIAVAQNGDVLAVSNGAIVALNRQSAEPKVVIAREQLSSPYRLAVDPRSGDILVAENSTASASSESRHQVKRFSMDGKLLKAYGNPEGRSDGAYIGTDFRGITDIEADNEGGFIITEGKHTPPRRTGRFNRDGELTREWLGCQHYGVLACPEPNDPSYVWTRANAQVPGLLRWKVDYRKPSCELVEIYQDTFEDNRLLRNHSAHGSAVPTIVDHGGRLYIYDGSMGSLVLRLYDPRLKRIRPCNVSYGQDGKSMIWNDLNDDGQVSDDELHQTHRNVVGGYIDPTDLSVRTTPHATRFQAGHLFRPTRFTSGGTPVYESTKAVILDAWSENGEPFRPFDFRRAPDGALYGSISDATRNPNEGTETHGAWYYNSCSAIDRLVKWDADGKQLWSVGRHSPDPDHETGSTAMPRGLVGTTHGCIVWADASDEEVARPTVWTEDGLYVDELLRVPNDRKPKEAYGMYNTNEYPSGHLWTNPTDGETFFYAINSGGGSPIYRISGWEDWHHDSGTISLKKINPNVATLAGTGLTAEYFDSFHCEGQPVMTRLDPLVYFNWGDKPPIEKLKSEEFSIRWTGQYESATNEDLRFEVRGSFPWRDRGKPRYTKLWLNGKLVIDSEEEHNYVRVSLSAGQRIDLQLECGFKQGDAAVALNHDTPSLDRRAVLPKFLYPSPKGLQDDVSIVSRRLPEKLAHFDFEQVHGTDCWSTAGRDVFGGLSGEAKQAEGISGHGIELSTSGEFSPALFPIDEELLLPDSEYAIGFWFKTTEDQIPLCEAKRYSSYNNRWSDHRIQLTDGKLRFQLKEAKELVSPLALNDGQWHHAMTSVGKEGNKLYVDGMLVDHGSMIRRATNTNRLGLDIGPGSGHGTVTLDEVTVLAKVPTPEEVREICAQVSGR